MSTAVYLGSWEPGSPDWHAARAQGLGGSEIAPVLGLSPWESRFSLWHRKTGLAAPTVENDVMYWGKLLESAIRDEWNRRHDDDTTTLIARADGTFHHRARPWQIANPDGVVRRYRAGVGKVDSLLECKTARTDDGWGEEGTDEIPVYYRTQCLWYLDVFGLDLCHVAVLIGGSDYREYQVTYSADECEFMRAKAVEFLGTVQRGERPDIDSHDATYQVVRELHPDIDDVEVEVPAEIAVPYLAAITDHKAATEEKQRTTALLADVMGSARRAYIDGQQIAMRVPSRGPDSPPSVRHTPIKAPGQKVAAA
ncbi:YqaJ viral recombinase family nuclease [Actinophytocola sediminis]